MQIYNSADNAKTDDIIYAMAIAAPSAIAQAKKANLADVIGLTGGNLIDDAIRTGKWIRANVKYKIDDFGNQNIQLPSALLRSGKGDCKSISLLYLSIMESAGYNGGFRYASYKDNRPFTHVYVYFLDNKKNIFTFDACIKDLKEVTTYKKIKDMKVNYIAGVPMVIQDKKNIQMKKIAYKPSVKELMRDDRYLGVEIQGVDEFIGRKKRGGGIKKAFTKVKTKVGNTVKKAGKLIKTVGLAPARGPFLLLVSLNFGGLARKLEILRSKNPSLYEEFWLKIGGDVDALNKSVNKGKDKKPLLASKKTKQSIQGATSVEYGLINGVDGDEYIGEPVTLATIGAAITTASGIIIALKKLFKKEGIQSAPGEDEAIEENPGFDESATLGADGGDVIANDPASEDAAQYAVTGGKKKPNISPSTKGLQATSDAVTTSVNPMYIGIGIAALGAIYLLTKKK